MEREILKAPPAPPLGGEAVQLLTRLCFGTQDDVSRSCEAAFIFGVSSPANQRRCVEIFRRYVCHQTSAKTVYIAGGRPKGPAAKTEAAIIRDLIDPRRYPDVDFLTEEESANTLENVVKCLPLGLDWHRELIFISKAHSAGRCRLSLAKHLPRTSYEAIRYRCYDAHAQCPDPKADGAHDPVSAAHWHERAAHRDLVWGEFLRIRTYGERGDIAYPRDVRSLVERVSELSAS